MKNKNDYSLHVLKRAIYNLRDQIDIIDRSLLSLINNRLNLVEKIGRIKKKINWCVIDDIRERQLLSKLNYINKGSLKSEDLYAIFSIIISASRKIQKKRRIAYFGSKAIISQILNLKHFDSKTMLLEKFDSEVDFFEELKTNFYGYGLIPIDFARKVYISKFLDFFLISDFKIYAEYFSEINYELVAKNLNPRILSTAYLCKDFDINCHNWLRKNVPYLKIVHCDCTMDAIDKALNNDKYAAVVAEGTAKLFGFKILLSSVESIKYPFKRYILIGNDDLLLPNKNKITIICAFSKNYNNLIKILRSIYNADIISIEIKRCYSNLKGGSDLLLINFIGNIYSKQFTSILSYFSRQVLWVKELGTYPVFLKRDIY